MSFSLQYARGRMRTCFFVVAEQLGRHGLELAAVEHIQKQSFDNVVTVMTQCNLVGANGFCIAIQSTATQS